MSKKQSTKDSKPSKKRLTHDQFLKKCMRNTEFAGCFTEEMLKDFQLTKDKGILLMLIDTIMRTYNVKLGELIEYLYDKYEKKHTK